MHRWFGLAVPVLTLVTLFAHQKVRTIGKRIHKVVYRGLLVLTLITLIVAGHLGGNLTHGVHYLTENAPSFIRNWMSTKPTSNSLTQSDITPDKSNSPLNKQAYQILEKHCFSCHGKEKQKGKIRFDLREGALATGQTGKKAIVPGSPLESHAFALTLLPQDHDDVMPPSGKPRMSAEEILAIASWIQSGAKY